ncbi:TAXI family TRAP transporter solute-binding subunit [Methylocapsa acidiphila]|uniref:TAXI family TRAP transporter solute-binding subunit n=1 Tax=Methylocapsa acidiphila TaxID=133552 RepID=UPI0012EC2A25|nr:TAXI family TRAP transporter solute-binding subunit [Methylocapsa acidiphila]
MLLLIGGILVIVAALIAAVYFWSPHANLRVTTSTQASAAQRFVGAFASVMQSDHPRVHIKFVPVADLVASAKALEDGATDLAIVRTDVAPPTNGQTIAILRRDAVAIVLPPKSSIDKVADLNGKTIAIPESPLQAYNEQAFDAILRYYDIQPKAVKRLVLPLAEIGKAVRDKRVAAILAVGPIGPGEPVDVVSAVRAATRGRPQILAIDEAEAIAKRDPGFESIDIPVGAFRGQPPTPDDTVTSVAVTYRFVAPGKMLNIVAGAIARSIFTAKAKLMAVTPLANQIEAPDTDEKNPILPVHPGVAAYLTNGEQSFFDEFQQYFYIVGMGLTALGSMAAFIASRMARRKSEDDLRQVDRLIALADRALGADHAELERLEAELNLVISWFVKGQARGGLDSTGFSVAIAHARHAIDKRRDFLRREGEREPQPPSASGATGSAAS